MLFEERPPDYMRVDGCSKQYTFCTTGHIGLLLCCWVDSKAEATYCWEGPCETGSY